MLPCEGYATRRLIWFCMRLTSGYWPILALTNLLVGACAVDVCYVLSIGVLLIWSKCMFLLVRDQVPPSKDLAKLDHSPVLKVEQKEWSYFCQMLLAEYSALAMLPWLRRQARVLAVRHCLPRGTRQPYSTWSCGQLREAVGHVCCGELPATNRITRSSWHPLRCRLHPSWAPPPDPTSSPSSCST